MGNQTKRSFLTIVAGHAYAVPVYEIKEGVGIVETGDTMAINLVRGSKISGENKSEPVPGTLHEHLVTVMIEDLKIKNAEFPSKETACAITNLEQARHWMEEREKAREAAGVLGTYQPHKS
ncbi:MAG: hypothetical protein V4619_15455 [Bacteroidota bacterium]